MDESRRQLVCRKLVVLSDSAFDELCDKIPVELHWTCGDAVARGVHPNLLFMLPYGHPSAEVVVTGEGCIHKPVDGEGEPT